MIGDGTRRGLRGSVRGAHRCNWCGKRDSRQKLLVGDDIKRRPTRFHPKCYREWVRCFV